jgi:hypothetical protein
VEFRHRRFPDLPPAPPLPDRLTLFDIDDLYTAPQCGFQNARDYYRQSSSAPLVTRIAVPARILFAADDPVVDASVLDGLKLPENMQVVKTAAGGHLGFLGSPWRNGGFRWLDGWLLKAVHA